MIVQLTNIVKLECYENSDTNARTQGEYEIVALQEDLKHVKKDVDWCERFREFMDSKYRKHLRLDPVLDSALIEGNNFAEHVKDCVRSPHWYVLDEDDEKEICALDLPTTSSNVVGHPPSTAIGTKASAYFDTVISALKIHMSSRKMSTVAYVLFNTHTLSLTHQTIEHTPDTHMTKLQDGSWV